MVEHRIAVHCFPPVSTPLSRLLILGSYPGVVSLGKRQYYAYPQNTFWKIMSDIVGFESELSYESRVAALTHTGIALWDVLYSCRRVGSLDSRIQSSSIIVNDFKGFFCNHPLITTIIFNGARAEQEFKKRVLPGLKIGSKHLVRLPSTSPAMASLSYEEKRDAWKVIKDYL